MLFWLAAAFAAPDHVVATVPSSSAVADLAVAGDEAWVAWVTEGGEIVVLDTTTWTAWNLVPEGGALGAAVAIGGGAAPSLFVALDDNTIGVWALELGVEPAYAAAWATTAAPLALEADDTTVYAVLDVADTGAAVMAYGIESGEALFESATDLANNGVVATAARVSVDESAGTRTITYLYIAQGGTNLSRVSVSASGMSAVTNTINEGSQELVDVWTVGSSKTWFAVEGAYSLGYQGSDSSEIDLTFLTTPDVGDATTIGGPSDGWMGLAGADGLHVYLYTEETGIGEEAVVLTEGANAVAVAGITGYALVGVADGVVFASDRPWVEIVSVSATTVTSEDTVELNFTSDTAGDWQVYRKVPGSGTAEAIDGASGSVEAGATATASFSLPASDEGSDVTWLVEVRVDGGDGLEGRDAEVIAVDEVPEAPTLSSGSITAGDQVVRVELDADSAEATTTYQVWISTVSWEPEDYATGGPEYVGPDADPGEITGSPDAFGTFSTTIGGLTNGQTYYVAVRAYDEAQEGAMSNVYSVTPEETYSVSQRLGLEGWCGLPVGAVAWVGVAGAVAAVGARRRPGRRGAARIGLLGLVAAAGLLAPSVAHARPHEDDLTPRNWNFEVRYGPFLSQDAAAITDAFGASDNRLLRAEIGYAHNLFEIDLNFGLYSDTGGQVTESGTTSSDEDTINAVPLALDATLRLDFFKEQPIVPFGRVGVDYWIWNEVWVSDYDDDGGGETTDGSPGWHWGAGLYLLLDPLDQGSASRLETLVGVNDTYVVAEYRQTYGFGADTLDFTSTELTFGLKFDY